MLSHPPLCPRTGHHKSSSPKLSTNSPTPIGIMITTNAPTIFSTRTRHLHACALISNNWTGRSRAHPFREVKIKRDEKGPFSTCPYSLMPYIEKLKVQLGSQRYWLFPSSDLLMPLHTAPTTYLGIAVGVLTTGARVCLAERVVSFSATLQTVAVRSPFT